MRGTVAVDFDGVIHSYTTPWQAADVIPDPPVPGAIDWLNEIADSYIVAIHTTRGETEGGRRAVYKWLRENGISPELMSQLEVTHEKVKALVYIDDRAYRFTGDNFPTAGEVAALVPWYKTTQDRSTT